MMLLTVSAQAWWEKEKKGFYPWKKLTLSSSFEKDLSPEEKALCRRYDPFMRFHSKEEHEDMLQNIVAEYRTRKRIKELEVK